MTQHYNKNELLFTPLGGCGEIGMNLNLYGYQGKWLMVDLGITFDQDLGLDIIMPDPGFIEENKSDLVGLVLTHAHEDHIGAVPYLWQKLRCPIYATPFTAFLVKEKLREADLLEQATIHTIPLKGAFQLGPFDLSYVSLTHSIPEPNALIIKTPAGVVVHSGDWKLDHDPLIGEKTDENTLKELGEQGVLALVCDSTNVFEKGHTGSEADVRKNLIKLVSKQKGRVVISCFASNVARLSSALEAARETGRRVAFIGRSLHRMYEAARSCGYLDKVDFLEESEIKQVPPEELLLICTGSQGEPRAGLSRIANRQHPRAQLEEGDTVFFSSRKIPGNEHQIKAVQEALIHHGINVITDKEAPIHVSGHPSKGDLKEMYSWVKPKILVPVHGEVAHMREQAQFGKKCGIEQAIVPANGQVIALNPENPGVVDEVHWGRLALDGNQLVPRRSDMLRDRFKLSQAGVIFVTLTLRKGRLKGEPLISTMGVGEPDFVECSLDSIKDSIIDMIAQADEAHLNFEDGLKEMVRVTVRRALNALKGKKPLVVTHLVFL
tara:strand:- start:1795 stop:3444 length:1650 start_codon:yes stop_codon:yes gene_type:complete